MATVYSDRGHGVRGPVVFYNRANEAAAWLKPGDFDWKAIFAGGVKWVHCGGIFAALSPTTAPLAAEMMRESQGRRRRYFLRSELPRKNCGRFMAATSVLVETIATIVENVDVLVGNEEDLQKGLGIPGPEVAAKSKLDPSVFFAMIENVVKKHKHVKAVATTLREVHTTNRHSWSAVAWIDGKTYAAPTAELDVIDRVGGGDGFAAGFIYGLLNGESPEESVKLGWAHGALLTTFPATPPWPPSIRCERFAQGGSAAHSALRGILLAGYRGSWFPTLSANCHGKGGAPRIAGWRKAWVRRRPHEAFCINARQTGISQAVILAME